VRRKLSIPLGAGLLVLPVALIAASVGGTAALWNDDEALATTVITNGVVDFSVNDAGQSFTLPASALASLAPGETTSVRIEVTGTQEGNRGLYYRLTPPNIAGNTGLTDATVVSVRSVASGLECSVAGGTTLYSGPLSGMVTDARRLVLQTPATTEGTEHLCFDLSLEDGDYAYSNIGSVTATGQGSSTGSVTVTDSDAWHGTAVADPAAYDAVVTIPFSPISVRPGETP
jgi:hypothetical protein